MWICDRSHSPGSTQLKYTPSWAQPAPKEQHETQHPDPPHPPPPPHASRTDLWHDHAVEVAVEAGLLGEDVVGGRGEEDAEGSGQGGVGAVGQREVVLPQEGGERRGLAREKLQSHRCPWGGGGGGEGVRWHDCQSARLHPTIRLQNWLFNGTL